MGNVSSLVQRTVLAARRFLRGPSAAPLSPGIVAVSADLGFYSRILSGACSWGWSAEWANSMNRALEVCCSKPIQIVIYDRNLPRVDWRVALDRLHDVAPHARILMASPEIDEDFWRTVLRRRGYDVMARTASWEQVKRELRFAWLSLQDGGEGEANEAVTAVLLGR
jgi:DNA-binding NtrC family response regulator